MLLKVIFKLLALRRKDFLTLSCLNRDLGAKFTTITCHGFSLDVTAHVFLDHECVHVDVGLKTATITWICKTVIFKVLSCLETLFLFSEHLTVSLDFTSL